MEWLKSHIDSRTQAVKVFFHVSDDFIVTSGVPQGLHLSALLFILFINDLQFFFFENSVNILFADNAKIFSIIKTPVNSLILQSN